MSAMTEDEAQARYAAFLLFCTFNATTSLDEFVFEVLNKKEHADPRELRTCWYAFDAATGGRKGLPA
jgi:hypothetical protein